MSIICHHSLDTHGTHGGMTSMCRVVNGVHIAVREMGTSEAGFEYTYRVSLVVGRHRHESVVHNLKGRNPLYIILEDAQLKIDVQMRLRVPRKVSNNLGHYTIGSCEGLHYAGWKRMSAMEPWSH